jgi:hypothetical protein
MTKPTNTSIMIRKRRREDDNDELHAACGRGHGMSYKQRPLYTSNILLHKFSEKGVQEAMQQHAVRLLSTENTFIVV